ncbi:MAG: hypothetical protein ACYDH8_08725 [Syntrophales bacterium]
MASFFIACIFLNAPVFAGDSKTIVELWDTVKAPAPAQAKEKMLAHLQELSEHHAAAIIYYQILFQLFKTRGDELDEERIVKSATGIKNTTV